MPGSGSRPSAPRSGLIVGLEEALVLVVVLGLAVWALVRLRRDRKPPPPGTLPPE